jgi:uncharacterized protein (TIGR04255 family)
MLGDLPPPSTVQLSRAPLQFVVCQIRHEDLEVDDDRWFAVHAALQERYSAIEPHVAQDLTINVGPNGLQASGEPRRGFKLVSTDGAWTVALLPNFFALESTGYTGWSEFRERLAEVIAAVAAEVAPRIETRLGLRFIDQLDPTGISHPSEWRERLNSDLAGVLKHPSLGPLVGFSQSFVQLRDGEFNVMLRHGVKPDGAGEYLIDTDCAREGGRRFEREVIMKDVDRLHESALQIFQTCLNPEYLKSLEEEV